MNLVSQIIGQSYYPIFIAYLHPRHLFFKNLTIDHADSENIVYFNRRPHILKILDISQKKNTSFKIEYNRDLTSKPDS